MQKFNQANIVLGSKTQKDLVFEMLAETLDFKPQANPDFLLLTSEGFGIDDARDLTEWALGKSLGPIKVAYISAKSVTMEAQNALLKLFEEPSLGTYIFLHLESLGNILPTFLSRVRVLKIEEPEENTLQNKADKFFNAKFKERLAMINSMAKSENKSDMKEILRDLEAVGYGKGLSGPAGAETVKNVLKAKIFSTARGSSPKMLLEWLGTVL